MKICSKCKVNKTLCSFHRKSTSPDGRKTTCKECHNKYIREEWYPRNKISQKKATKRWKASNKARVLSSRHSVPLEQVEHILSQNIKECQVCGRAVNKLNLDHCHSTNTVRGLLCHKCNVTLARLGDCKESVLEYCNKFLTYLDLSSSGIVQ